MARHPLTGSYASRVNTAAVAVVSVGALSLLVYMVAGRALPAMATAVVYSLVFLAGIYPYYFYCQLSYGWGKKIIYGAILILSAALLVTVVNVAGGWATTLVLWKIPVSVTLVGTLWFVVATQYYNRVISDSAADKSDATEVAAIPSPAANPVVRRDDCAEHITVKDRSGLQLVKVADITYISAYGDYVQIYTADRKFVKEETMKNLESLLPPNLIRIHRSHIVNADLIVRIESYGKGTYNVHLRQGVVVRASRSGHRQLIQALGL